MLKSQPEQNIFRESLLIVFPTPTDSVSMGRGCIRAIVSIETEQIRYYYYDFKMSTRTILKFCCGVYSAKCFKILVSPLGKI